MAGALVGGLLSAGAASKADVAASDPRAERLAELEAQYGIGVFANNRDLIRWANVVVLSVKPQTVAAALTDAGALLGKDHLLVSIAAGTTIASLEERVAPGARVIRAMPNTPALAGAGVTVTNYGDPDLFRMFFALASESGALAVARQRVQASVAARFDETPTPASVTETDTFLAGAQMGTRFMMGVMTVVPAPD